MSPNQYPKPEQYTPDVLLKASNLGEVQYVYNRLIEQFLKDYEAGFDGIASDHEEAFSQEFANPGTHNIDEVLDSTNKRVEETLGFTTENLDEILRMAKLVAKRKLDSRSKSILELAEKQAINFGIDPSEIDIIFERDLPENYEALKVAFDATLLKRLQFQVATTGFSSEFVAEILDFASTKNVRAALQATLDANVFTSLEYNKYLCFYADSKESELLEGASTQAIKEAMQAAIDIYVLEKARSDSKLYGIEYKGILETISHASSEKVKAVLGRQFPANNDWLYQSGRTITVPLKGIPL